MQAASRWEEGGRRLVVLMVGGNLVCGEGGMMEIILWGVEICMAWQSQCQK